MDKPTKPTDLIPRSFGGVKNNFSPSLQSSGYEDGVPAIYGGDNLNYQLDTTGKELDYCEKICDYINAIPIGKTITVDSNNKLVYVDKQELPPQGGNSGKYLTTDGSSPSWTNFTGANQDLSNLTTIGNSRLHALKGYKDEGELLTDSEGLADVQSYYTSAFNRSQFTLSGTATITNGILETPSTNSWAEIPTVYFGNYDNWKIKLKFTTSSNITSQKGIFRSTYNVWYGGIVMQQYQGTFVVMCGSTTSQADNVCVLNFDLAINTTYNVTFEFTGTQYILSYSTDDGATWTTATPVSSTTKVSSSMNATAFGNLSGGSYFTGTIDLRYFSVEGDGQVVAAGMYLDKIGIDTYTINSSTVTIPYTLSKTGSKIVDAEYRTQVSSVYNEFGYAPYYTLSDTDFTLPQGELYGMYNKSLSGTMPDYKNGISIGTTVGTEYTAPSDGYFCAYSGANAAACDIVIDLFDDAGNTILDDYGVLSPRVSPNQTYASIFIPFPKGYKVKLIYAANIKSATFYPMKGI